MGLALDFCLTRIVLSTNIMSIGLHKKKQLLHLKLVALQLHIQVGLEVFMFFQRSCVLVLWSIATVQSPEGTGPCYCWFIAYHLVFLLGSLLLVWVWCV